MGAIIGVLSSSNPGEANRLASELVGGLAFRGSFSARYEEPEVTLAVVAEEAGTRPWITAGFCVVADARIDNRDEVIAALELGPDVGDVELIGRSYQRWSHEWPKHVVGDFAVAIWDKRRRELSLARDAIGVRSLYWTKDERGLRCATEMRALARTRSSIVADRLQMALFLVNEYDERERTLYEGVFAVPPAHVLVFDARGEVGRSRYWFPATGSGPEREIDDYAEEFRTAFHRSVADCLRDVGPVVALEFSGGQDSTAVAATAAGILRERRDGPQPLGVTLVFPGLPCDERTYSRALAEHARLPLLEIDPCEYPSLLGVDALLAAPGDVYFHPTIAFRWVQLRMTRSRNARVTLTGAGSDHLAHRLEIFETADALRRRDVAEIVSGLRAFGMSHLARAALQVVFSRRARRKFARVLPSRGDHLTPILHRAVEDVLVTRMEELERMPHGGLTELGILHSLEHDLTRTLACWDRMSARERSELRHPFLDRRLVDLVASMPHAVVAGRGNEFRKPLLRRAMGPALPEAILQRRTITEFNPFVIRALFECAGDPRHLVRNGRVREYRLLDEAAISTVLQNPTSNANLRRLTNWVALEAWIRDLESLGEHHGRQA